jgi:hypothetical protein
MIMQITQFLHRLRAPAIVICALAAMPWSGAQAQEYRSRPIRF